MEKFNPKQLSKLYSPPHNSNGEDNGQVVIIGGSRLFHGAPLLALKAASKFVDMVFFASPDPSVGEVASKIKAGLFSFVWVPWEEVGEYLKKADAALIGPGLMRFRKEKHHQKISQSTWCDSECQKTREITRKLLKSFPQKKWVVDAGSLQVIKPDDLPEGCVITPNVREFNNLFDTKIDHKSPDMRSTIKNAVESKAREYKITIVLKGPQTVIASPEKTVFVSGGNAGLTKGGTGDAQAGLTVALLAKNNAFLAASAASYIIKSTADRLFRKVGTNFSSDDLVSHLPESIPL